ncbi:unnamed protein product [Symbiodinium necroappetens]|uniref:Uncharacterized protein n=1 Tax=Symbiodinium necroappetens TaxID=1628268 RepID=A0A813CJV6_9DINO|nr:unnamed protein product [Symbiodinium necroappetens]
MCVLHHGHADHHCKCWRQPRGALQRWSGDPSQQGPQAERCRREAADPGGRRLGGKLWGGAAPRERQSELVSCAGRPGVQEGHLSSS